MYEYIQYRALAEQLNASILSDHPCKSCRTGECCKYPNLKISLFDMKHLIAADLAGDLTEAKAIANQSLLKKGRREYCPFLHPTTHSCSIYPVRPFICMIFGYDSSHALEFLYQEMYHNRNNIPLYQLPSAEDFSIIRINMCRREGKIRLNSDLTLPPAVLNKVSLLRAYLEGIESTAGRGNIAKFASLVLGKEKIMHEVLSTQVMPARLRK